MKPYLHGLSLPVLTNTLTCSDEVQLWLNHKRSPGGHPLSTLTLPHPQSILGKISQVDCTHSHTFL